MNLVKSLQHQPDCTLSVHSSWPAWRVYKHGWDIHGVPCILRL